MANHRHQTLTHSEAKVLEHDHEGGADTHTHDEGEGVLHWTNVIQTPEEIASDDAAREEALATQQSGDEAPVETE